MAKLNQKEKIYISFMLHKVAFSADAQQRAELLAKLLEALNIDADQAAQSAASAKRSIRYDAGQKKEVTAPEDDLQRHIDGLYAQRAALLNERQASAPVDEAPTQPETTPASKLPTKAMRKRLQAFDGLSDGDQVVWLRDTLGL